MKKDISSMIDLNDLIKRAGIDPEEVMVMRHQPRERKLRAALPWLAAERPDLYNAYQRSQGPKVEAALTRARYLASFIGHAPGRALFIGLYSVAGWQKITHARLWKIPANVELRALEMTGPDVGRDPLWFDLDLTDHLKPLRTRLDIEWTGRELSWWRWAARNTLPVHAIHANSPLVKLMPDWQSLVLEWRELQLLPTAWRQALAQWRGIYYIFDRDAGLGYVGSAYGAENLLGRWMNYSATGHGGNRLLRGRAPDNFVFSILQRVSPDTSAEDVVAIENGWKTRLHSRAPYGLNQN